MYLHRSCSSPASEHLRSVAMHSAFFYASRLTPHASHLTASIVAPFKLPPTALPRQPPRGSYRPHHLMLSASLEADCRHAILPWRLWDVLRWLPCCDPEGRLIAPLVAQSSAADHSKACVVLQIYIPVRRSRHLFVVSHPCTPTHPQEKRSCSQKMFGRRTTTLSCSCQ